MWYDWVISAGPQNRFKWGFQQNVPLQMSTQQSYRKLKMSHVQLPTDSPRLHHIHIYCCLYDFHSSVIYWVENTFDSYVQWLDLENGMSGNLTALGTLHYPYAITIDETGEWQNKLNSLASIDLTPHYQSLVIPYTIKEVDGFALIQPIGGDRPQWENILIFIAIENCWASFCLCLVLTQALKQYSEIFGWLKHPFSVTPINRYSHK